MDKPTGVGLINVGLHMKNSGRNFTKMMCAGALLLLSSVNSAAQTDSAPVSIEQRRVTLEAIIDQLQDQVLHLQSVLAPGGVYTVRPGDTFANIAKLFDLRLDALMVMNPDMNPARLKVGMLMQVKGDPKANRVAGSD